NKFKRSSDSTGMLANTSLILSLALLVDAVAGYPTAIFTRIGHPVTWIGDGIAALDRQYNRETVPPENLKLAGIGALAVLIAVTGGVAYLIQSILWRLPLPFLWQALVASSLLAGKSLFEHVKAVASALTEGLDAGRQAVSQIVDRDSQQLDRHGVARTAIE